MGAVLSMTGCPSKKCVDKSKPALAECQKRTDALQRQVNDLKVTLAQALQNPGTIKVDPALLELDGPGKKRRVVLKEGTLKQEEVIKVIRLGKSGLQACYNRALKRNSALHHSKLTLTLDFKVRASGDPATISLRPNSDAKMIDCMKKAIKRWRFPHFRGQPVGVVSPVTLRPRG
ncbi:MAG: AgmX/PglI C-terminal domain-containing protein [Deltaproteobacteria bacterium]|nr:AgmX/PglI C-terminal domain-containing protein [Deltaproteobacteria bacterium]